MVSNIVVAIIGIVGSVLVALVSIIVKEIINKKRIRRKLDFDILNNILSIFDDDLKYFLNDYDLSGGFPIGIFTKMYTLEDKKNDLGFIFYDKKIEKLKNKLIEDIVEFKNFNIKNTYPIADRSVTKLWLFDNRDEGEYKLLDEYEGIAIKLNGLCSEVWNSYNNFVKFSKKRLK